LKKVRAALASEDAEESTKESLRRKWAQLEAMVGTDKRIALVAEDLVKHWEARYAAMETGLTMKLFATDRRASNSIQFSAFGSFNFSALAAMNAQPNPNISPAAWAGWPARPISPAKTMASPAPASEGHRSRRRGCFCAGLKKPDISILSDEFWITSTKGWEVWAEEHLRPTGNLIWVGRAELPLCPLLISSNPADSLKCWKPPSADTRTGPGRQTSTLFQLVRLPTLLDDE
jgi:hypothetical protein